MGSEVIARCKCGIEATILIGGGMSDFETTCYFPALCTGCSTVVQVNSYSDAPKCPDCSSKSVTLYNEPSLIGTAGSREVVRCGDLLLTDGDYKCPQCSEFTLQFVATWSLWD